MQKLFVPLACIVCTGYGQHTIHRLKGLREASDALEDAQSQSKRQVMVSTPVEALAMLLLAFNPATLVGQGCNGPLRNSLAVGAHCRRSVVKADETKGAIGGAVLGGLLAGPFGAIWGASLGSGFGANARQKREQAEELERMGLSEDMMKLAQQTAQDLAEAESALSMVQEAENSQAALVKRYDDAMSEAYKAAEDALSSGDEDSARRFLVEKNEHKTRKEAAELDLLEAKKRVSTMRSSVTQLAERTAQVEQMMSSIVADKKMKSIASRSDAGVVDTFTVEDPLERKFRDLEGK